jgi:hypothetical protein
MNDSGNELGFEASELLLEEAEAGRRQLAPEVVARLDRTALQKFLSAHGIPPAPWPEWIEIPPGLKAELWIGAVTSAKKSWAALAALAIEDLGPDGERREPALDVARRGIETARARGGSPLDWQGLASHSAYPELRSLLTQWARENVLRMRGDWETAYIVLGDDPGGAEIARAKVLAPIAGRLVTRMCEALSGPNGERARAWLDALATSPLRDIVPLEIKLELPAAAGEPWMAIARLRQTYEGTSASAETAPPEQRPFLERELEVMAQRAPTGTLDLAALTAQFDGELSASTLRALKRWIKPPRSEEPGAPAKLFAGIAALAREQKGKLKPWPKPKPKTKVVAEPEPEPESELMPTEEPAAADAEPTALQKNLLEWIRGGTVEDDRRADEEMIRVFEEGTADDLMEARKAIKGFGPGLLYRLASRAALNPRLLEGLARAVDSGTLDTILRDAAEYDLWGFAPQAAERLRRSRSDGADGPVEQAVLRLLRDGPSQVREALSQHLGAIDRPLLEELLGPNR